MAMEINRDSSGTAYTKEFGDPNYFSAVKIADTEFLAFNKSNVSGYQGGARVYAEYIAELSNSGGGGAGNAPVTGQLFPYTS